MQYFGYGPITGVVGGYGCQWYLVPPPALEAGYTDEEAARALRQSSRCVRYLCYMMQRNLVRIGVLRMRDMRIHCDANSAVPMSMAGSAWAEDTKDVDWDAIRLQPAMQVQMPDGGWYEWPLGVFLPITPRPRYDAGGERVVELSCYDMVMVLKDDKLDRSLSIPAGGLYIDAITTLVMQAGISLIIADRSELRMPEDLQFDMGTSRLEVVNSLLRAINYDPAWADERGYINLRQSVQPYDRHIKHRYIDDQLSVLAPDMDIDMDSYDVPNVIVGIVSRADAEPLVARWENTDPGSPLSIERRGRRVVRVDELDDAVDQDALELYVRMEGYKTRARNGQVTFHTLAMPNHTVRDMVYLSRQGTDISGRYMETGWEMTLQAGALMSHTVQRVVIL